MVLVPCLVADINGLSLGLTVLAATRGMDVKVKSLC